MLLALAAALTAATSGEPAAATTPRAPAAPSADAPANAVLAACRRAPSIEERVAVVGAWMRPLPAAQRLALRIDLQQRPLGARRWTLRDDVPGLGAWMSPSDPLVGARAGDVFKYRQAVGGLLVPYAYRFRVGFRWSNAAGEVVRESTVTTRACRQPDLRPDLVLAGVSAEPSPRDPALVRYAVVVRNDGRTPAAHVTVAATLPGETTPGGHVRGAGTLAPGASAVVRFTGAGCRAGEVPALFVADPVNAVEESDETNGELAGSCPAP
jgi:hypothetical protein